MRFLIHGAIHADAQKALLKHEHHCHTLPADTDAAVAEAPAELCKLLAKQQWNLLTTDSDFVARLYEEHVNFAGVIVLLLDDPAVLNDQPAAIDRLFERYHRLSSWRLYTVTASRVKIRQLPGANAKLS